MKVYNGTKVRSVRMLTVIEVLSTTGSGEYHNDPVREKRLYYTKSGELIATYDTAQCQICGRIACQSDHK